MILLEAIIISRRYHNHYSIYSNKQLTRAIGLFLTFTGSGLTVMGTISSFFLKGFEFFNIFVADPLFEMTIFLFIGPILLTIGIIFLIISARMSKDETPKAEIEYIRVTPEKITDLKCPACNAPLPKKPPCKCEYCRRMIRSL